MNKSGNKQKPTTKPARERELEQELEQVRAERDRARLLNTCFLNSIEKHGYETQVHDIEDAFELALSTPQPSVEPITKGASNNTSVDDIEV